MSSLPQGWHFTPDKTCKTSPKKPEPVSSVPKLKQKWNSSFAKEKPNSAIRRKMSALTLPNGMQSRITPPRDCAKSPSVLPKTISQPSVCPSKPVPKGRDYLKEIENLKKDASTYKAENIVLKAKVRKLEDESNAKARQITLLKNELQNESMNQKKNKESGAMLRQKVSKLEAALKEKDLAIKRMVTEMNSIKVEELRAVLMKYHKQFGLNLNGLGSDFFKKQKTIEPCTTTTASSAKAGAKDLSVKTQVDKLRNIVHKLESENQALHAQIKEKDSEIRRLKVQFSRQGNRAPVAASQSQQSLSARQTPTVSHSASQSSLSKGSVSRIPSSGLITRNRNVVTNSARTTRIQSKQSKSTLLPKISTSRTSFPINRVNAVPKQKPAPGKPARKDSQSDIERQAQIMRENIAARKIQQGWRNHRKNMSEQSSFTEADKALNFLSTELFSHSKRVEKLKFFNQTVDKMSDEEEAKLAHDVRNAFLSLFQDRNPKDNIQ